MTHSKPAVGWHASSLTYTPRRLDRDVALAFVAMVNHARVGDLAGPHAHVERRRGEPLSARTKAGLLDSLRTFFRDLQEWGWCSRRFDPRRTFATPRAINALIGPKPRVLADDVWAKLLWAGLQLDEADLHTARPRFGSSWQVYPLALVKAAAIAWLFAGLRSDELVRLRVGCIRWQAATGGPAAEKTHIPGDGATCLLDVPTHKTGASYTKPVDPLLGEAIAAWEEQRPPQPLHRSKDRRMRFGPVLPSRSCVAYPVPEPDADPAVVPKGRSAT